MPIYDYQCVDCGIREQRIAGLDDHTALCTQCGGLMLRMDEDVFQSYFEPAPPPGCDDLSRLECEAYRPDHPYCQSRVSVGLEDDTP
jgi:putative FmdB family regulatory protein